MEKVETYKQQPPPPQFDDSIVYGSMCFLNQFIVIMLN